MLRTREGTSSTPVSPLPIPCRHGCRSAHDFDQPAPIELVVALGRDGKQQTQIDSYTHPRTAPMPTKLQSDALGLVSAALIAAGAGLTGFCCEDTPGG